ncbi:MAG TPA: DAK2 domain-containing protein [Chloroflexi bacterium]|jgi:DAK2 domain fusion protein YloV|nr:DAK2 domain-containing protein [Chloroflexota bacterium]
MGQHHTSTEQPDQPSAPRTRSLGCDGDHLLRCLQAGSAWLDAHVAAVNALNVFPVPDGDTGTNMSLTMRAALNEAGNKPYRSVSELARVVAHGALMGARGNSGVILSQIMRGFSRALDDLETIGPQELAAAFAEGANTAYKGVMKPVEGTILTVAREAAEAAQRAADAGGDVKEVLAEAVSGAQASLARTPTLLPVLAAAGVVDAGAQGYTYLLEGALRHVLGETIELAAVAATTMAEHLHAVDGDYNYDTQFVILGENLDVDAIREHISSMGDSVLVVGDASTVKVHVHSDFPGKVLDYGISQGQLTAIIIENMQEQYEAFRQEADASATPATPVSSAPLIEPSPHDDGTDTCVIAVVSGEGLERVFESLGVSSIVLGGQTMNPSIQDLLSAVESSSCPQAIVLPNNRNVVLAARQAAELASKKVVVVPTRTIPQGIAALLAYNYQADLTTNAQLMLDASNQVQTAEITRAVRSVQVNGLSIEEGQIIGLLNGDLTDVGSDVATVMRQVLERIGPANYEILTMYYGEDVSSQEAEALAETIHTSYPDLEVEVLNGGQAHYYYILSVE